MKNKKSVAISSIIAVTFSILFLFVNCSRDGFDSSSLNNQIINRSTSPLAPDLTFYGLNLCYEAEGAAGLANCLEVISMKPDDLTQTRIDACVDTAGDSAYEISNCLWKGGIPVDQYREARQIDIDSCSQAAGNSGINNCLIRNGFGNANISQDLVNQCINNVGLDSVEKCLRSNGALSTNPIVTKRKIDRCLSLVPPSALAECMDNSDFLPEGVDQTQIGTCITNAGVDGIISCLRANNFIESMPQQRHIAECASAYGNDFIAACLVNNGFILPLLSQDIVNTCITNVGLDSVARCLRVNNVLDSLLSQDDIEICNRIVGQAGIAACLDANGLRPPTLLQENIDACIVDVGLANAANCLAANNFIASRLSQLTRLGGVFQANCVGCHDAVNGPLNGNFIIEDFASLSLRVVPGDPATSLLFMRMNDPVLPMPPGGVLNAVQLQQVESWVLNGAAND